MRARELGVEVGTGMPGRRNAITDVEGVRVGAATVIEGDDVRTGVTVVVPPAEPLFAGCHRLNGNGELTGLEWVRESGMLTTPVGITNTNSVGVVRDAIAVSETASQHDWSLPVVGETWDGFLNDVRGRHVREEHVHGALASASADVQEGNAGGGTGMICHGFKGGTGTASRVAGGFTVGVLVQANHGRRARLRVNGVPVGLLVGPDRVPLPGPGDRAAGSIIVVVATDAPLLPGQCDRLAQRAALGVARTGGAGENSSGDLVLCFATGNRDLPAEGTGRVALLPNEALDPLFHATIEATEEAILNALVAAETMTGRGGAVAHALPHDLLLEAMRGR